ncbi:ATP-binding cassette domain-containing protein [Hymenobacter algoricola]|uniref:ABC transporter domain-containing protein n=1 Tax=Hymenobacter algoricola TaxID=486267 RepID=A0ABP7NIW6_9BACT
MGTTLVAKAFGPKVVLHEVSLQLRPATIHGLVGVNGAGKTTLLNCIYGLTAPDAGTIGEASGRRVRELTGVLPYEPYFYPRLTGLEYLTFCRQARRQPMVDVTGWNQLFELPLNQYAEQYSAGMKKKLALLGLLIQDFRYLILDEPFNGLDLETNLLLREILLGLRGQGRGILLTSHLLGALTEVCDEVTVLAAGTVQRHYAAAEFGQLAADLQSGDYQQKLALLRQLL